MPIPSGPASLRRRGCARSQSGLHVVRSPLPRRGFFVRRRFQERCPSVELFGRDPEGSGREVGVSLGDSLVERLERHIEEDRLHLRSQFFGTVAVIVAPGSPDHTVDSIADVPGLLGVA